MPKESLPSPTRDRDQLRKDMDQWGYCLIRDAISADMVKAARDRIIEQAEEEKRLGVAWLREQESAWIGSPKVGDSACWQGVRLLLNKGRIFQEILTNALMQEMTAYAFRGIEYNLSSMNALILRKGAPPQTIHCDQQMIPEISVGAPYVNNIMLMLSPFTEANGATRIVPGSHKWGRYPSVEVVKLPNGRVSGVNTEDIQTIAAEGEPGTAMVFEGRLWHGAGHATDEDDVRYSIVMYHCAAFMRQQDVMPASILPEVYDGMSEDLRELIGFGSSYNLGMVDPIVPNGRTNTRFKLPYVPYLPVENSDFHEHALTMADVDR